MSTPYDKIADKFIEAEKELDGLPIRREAAKRRKEEERRVPTATPQPVPPLPPITPPGPAGPPVAGPGPFFAQRMAELGPITTPGNSRFSPEIIDYPAIAQRQAAGQQDINILLERLQDLGTPGEPGTFLGSSPDAQVLETALDILELAILPGEFLAEDALSRGLDRNPVYRPSLSGNLERFRERPLATQIITAGIVDPPFCLGCELLVRNQRL